MKTIYTLLTLILVVTSTTLFAQLTETEPNNELGAANNLPLDTEMSGEICIWNNEDWYQIELPEDGYLQITVSSAGQGENPAAPFYFQLYSSSPNPWPSFDPEAGNNGVMTTNEGGWCCLKAGTFYIQVYSGYAFDYCYDYTFHVSLLPATFGNDEEPNSSLSDNLAIIAYNTPTDAHLSFINDPQNGGTDNYDYFKLVSPINGQMRLIIENEAQSTGSENLSIMMHNAAGTTWYQQVTAAGTFQNPHIDTLYWDCTPDDTLIAMFFTSNFYDRGYAYRFRYDVVEPHYQNDIEPNNTQLEAQLINIAEPATGNQYYYGDNSDDVFKFLKPDTGFFKVRVTSSTNSSDGTLGTKVQVLDNNFNLLNQLNAPLGVNGELGIDSLYFQYLPADTFYIRVGSDYAFPACRSYLLEFDALGLTNVEEQSSALQISVYPNPASSEFVLDTRRFHPQCSVQIMNMIGEVVMTKNIYTSSLHTIDIHSLTAGVYFIDVFTQNEHRIERIVVRD